MAPLRHRRYVNEHRTALRSRNKILVSIEISRYFAKLACQRQSMLAWGQSVIFFKS
jgi:hypothetical protein